MSDDDGDLHGRQLLILLAFFSSFGGLLLLIAWITRPNWLWDAIGCLCGRGGRLLPGAVPRRVVGGGLLTLAALAIIPAGISAGRDDQRVAEAGPVQQAMVLSVKPDKWSNNHDLTIKVARPGDGTSEEIRGADDLEPLPKVGDQIPVIIDPDDASNVPAADADWTMHWYWYVLIVVTALICAGFALMLALP